MNPAAASSQLLTVSVVEGIHSAAIRGGVERVRGAIASITDATLPGLVEYQCLRHSTLDRLDLPELPIAVRRSLVGAALDRVVCPFGFRLSGQSHFNTEVNPQAAEFFFLRTENEYVGHDYQLFETRWARAAERIGLRGTQSAMHLAISAMTENGILHAESTDGVLVGYRLLKHAVLFTVADLGRGVLASLRTNPKFAHLDHPRDALRLALHDGISRLDAGGGYGFRQLFRALANQFGTIRFRTGNVGITMDGQDFSADIGNETFPEAIAGFQVTMCCRRSADSDVGVPAL